MPSRNNRNSLKDRLMNIRVVVSVLVAVFVMVGLASPAIAHAASDAVLVMHFDEGSGTIAKDESGYGNDGTIYGATWADGISGKALRFDGVDDYVDRGSNPSLNFAGDEITFEAWIKPNSRYGQSTPRIVGHQGTARLTMIITATTGVLGGGLYIATDYYDCFNDPVIHLHSTICTLHFAIY